MEAYSSSSSSSSKAQSSLPYYTTSLHSVRKAPAKPWKKPVAPQPPTPPRVYKVDPINFRDLVQRLTAAPEFQLAGPDHQSLHRLHTMAPPPVNVETSTPFLMIPPPAPAMLHRPLPVKAPSASPLSAVYKEFSDALDHKKQVVPQNTIHKASETMSSASPTTFLGLNLSPPSNSYNWCSFPMLSPGTLSSLEQRTVL